MQTILIALDLGAHTHEVEATGFTLAAKLGARVLLASFIDGIPVYEVASSGEVISSPSDELLQSVKQSLQAIRQKYPALDIQTAADMADPKAAILELAWKEQASMIVVGTHGRTGLSTMLIGSTAEYLVRHSPVPVLVVPFRRSRH